MKRFIYSGFLMVLVFGIFQSCTNEFQEPSDSELGLDYFPLSLGKYCEYQADSTIFDDNGNTIIQTTSFIREEITDTLEDEAGNKVFVIERFWKRQLDDAWLITDVWTANYEDARAIKTEENLRFIKLVFPPTEGLIWNGNAFIDPRINIIIAGESIEMFKNWEYQILSLSESELIGLFQFDQVVTVQQADDENQIERRYSIEKYARGVGLAYREMMIMDTQCIEFCAGQAWEEKAQKGFVLRQTIIDYN